MNVRRSGSERVPTSEQGRSPMLRWLLAPLRLLFKIYFGVVFFLSLIVLYIPFRYLLRKERRHHRAFRLKRKWAWFLQYASLVPIRVERRTELPARPYIICANHSSYLDIIQMYNVIPDHFLFIGKYELLRWPLFGIFFRYMDIAVNRGSHNEAAKAFMRASKAIENGASMALFPEGTIPRTAPRMMPFKDGAFRMAIENQVPIVPVTFRDHWILFGDPEDLLSRGRPGIAHAVVHPAVHTKGLGIEDVPELRDRIFAIIEAPLLEDADQ